jgi:hypothetical protein
MKAFISQRIARLSRRERRAVSLCLLVVIPAVAFNLVVKPYVSRMADVGARVEREQDLLRREQTLLAEVKAYPSRLRQAEATLLREAPRLFAGSDLVAASSALSSYVTGQALTSHVFVQQSQTGSLDSTSQGVGRLKVELRAVGDLEGILAFLQRLESGPKLVTVERLAIAQTERLGGGEPRDDEVLSLSATVGGYALAEPNPETR